MLNLHFGLIWGWELECSLMREVMADLLFSWWALFLVMKEVTWYRIICGNMAKWNKVIFKNELQISTATYSKSGKVWVEKELFLEGNINETTHELSKNLTIWTLIFLPPVIKE